MIVAVIGANGFVGTRLVEMFHLSDRHVVVPVVRRPSALALCARFTLEGRIADALDVAALTAALKGCEAVVHVALGDPGQIAKMPAVLCAAASAAGVRRVVYLSSAAVHGPAPAPDTNEESPLHTRHAMDYNNAKVRAERAFLHGCARNRLEGFALRPGVVLGPRSRWITDLVGDLRGHRAWLLDGGAGVCNLLYVDDLVEAVAQCLVAPSFATGAYLIGDDGSVTWAQLYQDVARSLGLSSGTIHHGSASPVFTSTPAEKLARFIAGPLAQAALPLIPSSLKKIGKRVATALTAPAPCHDAWSVPVPPTPRITQELALLQQNTWQLSSARAKRLLGYKPTVDYPAALSRSLGWLAFAEGRS